MIVKFLYTCLAIMDTPTGVDTEIVFAKILGLTLKLMAI